MKKLPLFLILLSIQAFVSCQKNSVIDPCQGQTYQTQFQDEINAVNTAASNYAMDPTTSNCNAFKSAYNNYIDALDAWDACATVAGQRTEYEQAKNDARAALDDLSC